MTSGRSYIRGPRSKPLLNAMGEAAKFLANTARRFVNDKANTNDVEVAIAAWKSACPARVEDLATRLTAIEKECRPHLYVDHPDGLVTCAKCGDYDKAGMYSQCLLEKATTALAAAEGREAGMRAERDKAQRKQASMAEELTDTQAELATAKAALKLVETDIENVWMWQSDGDEPESLSCPVMSAETLRKLVAGKVP